MIEERKQKIVDFIEKKRAEGKLGMPVILGIIEEVERKARAEVYAEVMEFAINLERRNE